MLGTNLEKTREISTKTVTLPVFREAEGDGLFALIDGGKVVDAAAKIESSLVETIKQEIKETEPDNIDHPLLYLEHTFLTSHRSVL